MMHGFSRVGPVLTLALTTIGLACMPGQLDTTGWLRDGGVSPVPPPPQPPAMMADAQPAPVPNPDTAPPPPPPPPMPDAGTPDMIASNRPDAPPAAESWCTDGNEVIARLLQPKCGTCHGSAAKAGGLDLVTAGVKARLIDVPSTICRDRMLVTMTPQVGGHLFSKLEGAVCGDRMPAGGLPSLSAAEIQCLKAWIVAPAQSPQ
jgi:hypothetical protein